MNNLLISQTFEAAPIMSKPTDTQNLCYIALDYIAAFAGLSIDN